MWMEISTEICCRVSGGNRSLGTMQVSESEFQMAHRITRTKFSEHLLLCDVALKLEVSADIRTQLMLDHQRMGLCFGLSEALAEMSSRVEMMSPDADDFLSLSCALGLRAVNQGVRCNVRGPEDGTPRFVRLSDMILQDTMSSEDTYLVIAKAVQTMKHLSSKEMLAAVFGVVAVLASALGAASKEGSHGAEHHKTAIKCSPKVFNTIHSFIFLILYIWFVGKARRCSHFYLPPIYDRSTYQRNVKSDHTSLDLPIS